MAKRKNKKCRKKQKKLKKLITKKELEHLIIDNLLSLIVALILMIIETLISLI